MIINIYFNIFLIKKMSQFKVMLQFSSNQVLIACTHEINIGNNIEFGKCYSGKDDEYFTL